MTDKELRKLKRRDLLEIMFYMREEIDNLHAENDNLKARINELTDPIILHNNIRDAVTEVIRETAEKYMTKEKGGDEIGRTEESQGHSDSSAV